SMLLRDLPQNPFSTVSVRIGHAAVRAQCPDYPLRADLRRSSPIPNSPTVCYGALDPPVGGTFHFENLIVPTLTKTCPKMVLSNKVGSLCVKDAVAKKFFGVGRDSAGGALASQVDRLASPAFRAEALEASATCGMLLPLDRRTLCRDARGRDGGVRQKLAAGVRGHVGFWRHSRHRRLTPIASGGFDP